LAANGDRVLALRDTSGLMLWRGTDNGAVVWARRLDGYSDQVAAPVLHADPANGVVLQGPLVLESIAIVSGEALVDTLRLHTVFTHIAPNGDLDWRRELVVTFDYPMATMIFRGELVMTALPDGLAVAAHVLSMEHDDFSVVKLDMQGQVQWANSYRWTGPYTNQNASELIDVVPDQAGGLYLCGASPWGFGQNIFVTHMDQYGAFDWAKSWKYTNAPDQGTAYGRAVPMPDGSITIAGKKLIPGHDYLSTIRVDQSGNLVDASFYTHPPGSFFSKETLGRPHDGTMLLGLDSVVVALAEDGTVQAAAVMESSVLGEMRNSFIPMDMCGSADGAVLFGVLDEVHVDLGFTYHRPAVRMVAPSAPGCHAAAVQVDRVVVPTDLYQMQDRGTYVQQTPQVTVTTLPGTSIPRAFIATNDLCEAMVITGMAEGFAQAASALVNTVARRGEPLRFATGMAHRVSILDATGRTLSPEQVYAPGAVGIATDRWPAGTYLVRISDADGSSMQVQRVVIVP
jgi:hypothetical protein